MMIYLCAANKLWLHKVDAHVHVGQDSNKALHVFLDVANQVGYKSRIVEFAHQACDLFGVVPCVFQPIKVVLYNTDMA